MTTDRRPITGAALLRWIELELPDGPWPEREPFVGFVYLDPQAGLSAKGGRRGDPGQRERPSLTLRAPLPGVGRVLEPAEATQAGLATHKSDFETEQVEATDGSPTGGPQSAEFDDLDHGP